MQQKSGSNTIKQKCPLYICTLPSCCTHTGPKELYLPMLPTNHSWKKCFCLREPVFWGGIFLILRRNFPMDEDFPNIEEKFSKWTFQIFLIFCTGCLKKLSFSVSMRRYAQISSDGLILLFQVFYETTYHGWTIWTHNQFQHHVIWASLGSPQRK